MKKKLFLTFTLVLALLGSIYAQQSTVSGTVTAAADGLPLPGVTILVQGAGNIGTITDADGKYSVKVPAGSKTLTFSFIGMETKTVNLGTSSVINVALETSTEALEEVVVTALGIQREKKALGFAAQEVGEKELSASRESNITSYLTAKVAGVQISKSGAGTSGSSSVLIRGASSLTGSNQPLYVVDGVPIINLPKDDSGSGGMWGDNDYGDGIGDIKSEDVLSMTVLKGPNASALYGSRGANGVILITTKSGKKRKGIGVEVNSNVSVETLNLIPTFQNYFGPGYEDTNIYGNQVLIDGKYYETMETWLGDNWGPPLDGRRTVVDPYVFPADKNKKTRVLWPKPADNVRNFYETGVLNTNNIAISGGTDKTTARLSIGNSSSKGIVPNEKYSKQNITLRTTSQVTDYLSFDAKFNYIHSEGNQRPGMGYSTENVSRIFAGMARVVPMDFMKEYYETTKLSGTWPGISYNPYYVVNELKNFDNRDRFISYISGTLKFTDWLSVMGRVGADIYSEYREKRWPVGSLNKTSGITNSNGRLTTDLLQNKDINADVILTATKELSSNFTGTASFGASYLRQDRNSMFMDARNFKAAGVYHVSNALEYYPSSSLWQKEMQSVFFTGQLAYKNYLFLDVTGRNDWSSALGINEQSFFYPSVATSFVFTDALSIDESILSFGKVRASWAQVGNDSDPYLTQSGYNSYTTGYSGRSFATKNGQIPLYNLKNELSESWEVGADLRFLKNRLNLDVTYYNGFTTNQILPAAISNASGYASVIINAGRVNNSGLEIVLNGTPVKTASGFIWDISANFARNRSKVVELAPGVETHTILSSDAGNIEARVDAPFGNIIGFATRKAPDGQLIVGSNGAYVREPLRTVLGNIQPDWIGGLNNTFTYKGISLNVLLDFKIGGELISQTKYRMMASGTGEFTAEGRRLQDKDDAGNQLPYVGVLQGVVETTDASGNVTYTKNTKAVDGQTYWANRAWGGPTDWFVLDASYINLREVMLSYNFPKSLMDKTPLTGLTVSVVGRNLMYLVEHMEDMGISPESHPNTEAGYAGIETFSNPTTRTFGLNVKLTF